MSEPCDKFKRVPSPGGLTCECGYPIYDHADGTYAIKYLAKKATELKEIPAKGN